MDVQDKFSKELYSIKIGYMVMEIVYDFYRYYEKESASQPDHLHLLSGHVGRS